MIITGNPISRFRDQVLEKVWKQSWAVVSDQVWEQVWCKVEDNIRNQSLVQVRHLENPR